MDNQLTTKEEEIMQILWNLKKAFVKEIRQELPDPKPPYTTVASTVKKLLEKGFVKFQTYGNTNQYSPTIQKKTYRKRVFKKLLKGYFESSPEELFSFFVKEEKMEEQEIKAWFKKIKNDKS